MNQHKNYYLFIPQIFKNMKKFFTLLFAVLTFSITTKAQTATTIIAVVNKANWCHVCQANGEKMMKEVMPVFENTNVRFVMNDLTDDNSRKKSDKELKETKVAAAVKDMNATGLILLINANTGKLVDKISVAEPANTIVAKLKEVAMKEAM